MHSPASPSIKTRAQMPAAVACKLKPPTSLILLFVPKSGFPEVRLSHQSLPGSRICFFPFRGEFLYIHPSCRTFAPLCNKIRLSLRPFICKGNWMPFRKSTCMRRKCIRNRRKRPASGRRYNRDFAGIRSAWAEAIITH